MAEKKKFYEAEEYLDKKRTLVAPNRFDDKEQLKSVIIEMKAMGVSASFVEDDEKNCSDTLVLNIPKDKAIDLITYFVELSPDAINRVYDNVFELWWD